MDLVSILVIAGIVVLCALPYLLGLIRSKDRKANDIEAQNPEAARALREARLNIDRGRGFRGRP